MRCRRRPGRRLPRSPRTAGQLADAAQRWTNLCCLGPLPYLEFVGLVADAELVLTDSGGIQEETTVLGVPCLTIRNTTERPVTCQLGTNRLIGTDPAAIAPAVARARSTSRRPATIPLWDGQAGRRIADILFAELSSRPDALDVP